MPARIDGSITTETYRSSLSIPADVIAVMKGDPRSNIIFSKVQKYRSSEVRGCRLQSDEFWIVCKTTRTTSRGSEDVTVDFVLACTYGVIGNYPIFMYGTKLEQDLSSNYLEMRMKIIVRELLNATDSRRVYSIFAVEPVARSFSACWFDATRIGTVEQPYYDSKFSYCTAASLATAPPQPQSPSVVMRVAKDSDLEQVAQLCKEFAADSPPFILSTEQARFEADTMIRAGQVWVLEVQSSRRSSIACIVCLTRPSETVTAITKVYTPPAWRQKGYARRLVQRVCEHLFANERKEYVVLYVGRDNSAANVYHRVGFVGLEPGTQSQYMRVENWLELGFDRTKVVLGHW